MSSIKYKMDTEDQSRTYTITWVITNFRNVLKNNSSRDLKIFSEKSKDITGDPLESGIHLKMQFLGHDNDIIEIYYLSLKPYFLSYDVRYQYGTLPNIALKEYHNIFVNKWQYMGSIFKRDIGEANSYNYYNYGNNLSILLKFTIINDIKVESLAQLSENFENLLNNGLYSDVTMKSADGDVYKVHKVVLASRSAVLKAHFEHNTTECSTNTIESPFDADVLREVLTFVYTNKAPRVDEIAEKLLVAADYYQLIGLINLCEEPLFKQVTAANAIQTLQLADKHSASNLKLLIMEFIKDGPSRSMTKTDGWANLESVKLIKDVCEHLIGDNVIDNE